MSLLRRSTHQLAAPYALDALDHGEARRFEKHLARCERCAAEVRVLRAGAVRLAHSVAVQPPPEMRARVLAAIRTTPQEPAPGAERARPSSFTDPVLGTDPGRPRGARTSSNRPRPGRRPLFAPLAATATAFALTAATVLGVLYVRASDDLDRQRAAAREISQVLAAPDARTVTDRDVRGRGINAVASPSLERAVVTVTGLAQPAGGRVHQLWLMEADDEIRSLGLLDADSPVVASGLGADAERLAVTEEPAGGSAQPTTEPLVQVALESAGFGQ
ncbi:anti-sigma factor domain-containing protein [Streptomyces sp. GC420]|uniref:anti-sigma factor n=1 Tax=Streptomyces sp. GC420 TaxID=2697568 RepID=UPI00141510C1|nr:anti-sigma factor [Streptomyces sp. GC420]NBM18458.1 anti-sigma factor [Streptomyces sp. GC420]